MKKRVVLFYFVTALFWFSLFTYVPVLGPYAESLGAAAFLIGLITGSYGAVQMLLRIPLGIVSDALRRRKIFIIIGTTLAIVAALGMYLFSDRYVLLVFRAVSGMSASFWVVFAVLFSSYFDKSESMKSVGILNSANAVGTSAAMLLGGVAALQFGTRSAFLLGAAAGSLALLLSLFLTETRAVVSQKSGVREIMTAAWRTPGLLKVSVLGIIAQYVVFASTLGFATIVARSLGAGDFTLGLLGVTGSVPGFFVAPFASTVLTRRYGAKRVIASGFLISAVSCAAIPFVPTLFLLFASQFIGGVGRNMVFPLLMGLCIKDVPEERRGVAMGFFQAVYGLGMFLGPAFAGALGGRELAFVVTGVVAVFGAVLSLIW